VLRHKGVFMNEEVVGAKPQQSFMEELRNSIGVVYEMAVSLDREVVDRREKYLGQNCADVKEESVPDNMCGQMFALIHRTMEMLDRARKYVLEI